MVVGMSKACNATHTGLTLAEHGTRDPCAGADSGDRRRGNPTPCRFAWACIRGGGCTVSVVDPLTGIFPWLPPNRS
jgi:hypothetical protein